jgi:uncharacterized SAM-binding protein YcdF (DUF218 family)
MPALKLAFQKRSLLIRIVVASLLIALAVSFLGFADYEKPKDLRGIETAIVFSGADERVRVGLELLKARVVKRLYISGANPNAGIWLDDFEKKFANGGGNMRPLLECCIRFGTLADTTLQNALETRCWLGQQGLGGPIVLITSPLHMPRARAALRHLLPLVAITPYPVPEDRVNTSEWLRRRTIEYMKYLATVALLELPSSVLPEVLYGAFYSSCPLSPGRTHSDQSSSLRSPKGALTF